MPQEISNIIEIEQQLNKDSQYITIAVGNSRILRFVTERKIEVEKTYNGQVIKKIHTDYCKIEIMISIQVEIVDVVEVC